VREWVIHARREPVLVPAVEMERRIPVEIEHRAMVLVRAFCGGRASWPKASSSARGDWLVGVFCQEINLCSINRRLVGAVVGGHGVDP
jgi:hypothetical protein